MHGLLNEIRQAFRLLRKDAPFTLAAILTLAIAIGANCTIFSVINTMLLRSLPYPDGDRLVALRALNASLSLSNQRSSAANLRDWQLQARSFDALAGYRWRTIDFTGGERSERLRGLVVTPQFFAVMGVRSVMGRIFAAEEYRDKARVIILGNGIWKRRFASDPTLTGRPLGVNIINLEQLGPTAHTIVGIVADDVHFPPLSADFQLGASGIEDTIDFWTPAPVSDGTRHWRDLDIIGRLRPGITVKQAQAEMDAIADNLAAVYPASNRGWRVQILPLRDYVLGDTRLTLLLLSLCTGFVLLIACSNVANLMLSRGVARQKEVAIRAALGAGRLRIARQFLVEAALIALLAAGLGVLLTFWGIALLRPLIPPAIPLVQGMAVDGKVLVFALLAGSATALMTGVVPGLRLSRANLGEMIKSEGRSASPGQARHRIAAVLVGSEVALSLILLIGTGLMVKSAAQLWQVDPGFDSRNLLTMTISLPNNKYEWKHNVVFSRRVIELVKELPQVRDASVVQGVPMRPGSFETWLEIEGKPRLPAAERPMTRIRVVDPAYFRVMKIPLVSGRGFNERDEIGKIGAPPFVIVNRTLAELHWPGQDAVGKKISTAPDMDWFTIVGIVGDVRYGALDMEPGPELYYPEGLFPQPAITLLVRTDRDPLASVSGIRERIRRIDPEAFVTEVKPMAELIADSVWTRRFSTLLLTVFAAVALALALTGTYSVGVHSVAQRRVEIGIRMALGATPGSVVGLMVRYGVVPALAGIALGLAGALLLSRMFASMLFEVRPLDPPTWVIVPLVMLGVSFLATYIAARKATTIDPSITLRGE